jgi:hypothetical protein
MKRLLVFFGLVAALAIAATPAYAAGPEWTAHAFFQRTNPFYSCAVLKLDLQVTQSTATVGYWAHDTCFNFDYPHLTGSTTLTPDQVSLASFDKASVANVVVPVSGSGYSQVFTFNLTWTGSGQITVSAPIGGTGQVARQSAATVSGSVLDLGGNTLFSGSDATQANIAEVFYTLT